MGKDQGAFVVRGQEFLVPAVVQHIEPAEVSQFLWLFKKTVREPCLIVQIDDEAYKTLTAQSVFNAIPRMLRMPWNKKEQLPQIGSGVNIRIRSLSTY